MKRIIVLLVIMVIVSGCGSGKKVITPDYFKDIDKKTGIHLNAETDKDGGAFKLNMYLKGDQYYINYEASEEEFLIIGDGKEIAMLDQETKTATRALLTEDTKASIDNMISKFEKVCKVKDIKPGLFTVKETKIDGNKYYAEVIENGESAATYAYDEGKLIYVISETASSKQKIKINELDSETPDGIFEIPEDYEVDDQRPKENQTGQKETSGMSSGKIQVVRDDVHGNKFETDAAYTVDQEESGTTVYTNKDGQIPYFRLSIMQNASGQSADELLAGIQKQAEEKYDFVVTPKTNKLNIESRDINGLEYVREENGKNLTCVQYVEEIGGFFYTWTGVYYQDDTVTPKSIQKAIETFEMLAS